jgi:hypothetical protein
MTKTAFFIHDDVNLVQFVIPGLTRNPVFSWIPTFAGMTCSVEINDAVYEFRILVIGIYLLFGIWCFPLYYSMTQMG